MSIDDTVLAINNKNAYSAGGIVISIDNPIKVSIKVLGDENGILHIDKSSKKTAVINHE
jgi:hypothetical protein